MLNVGNLLGSAAGLIGNLVAGVASGVRNVGSPLVSGIATIVDGTVIGIADLAGIVVGNLANGVSGFVSTIGNWAGGLLNTVIDFVNNAAHDIVEVIGGGDIADELIPPVDNNFQENFEGLGGIAGPIIENVGGAFEGVGSNIFPNTEPILGFSPQALSASASGGGIGPLSAASAASAPAGVSMLSAAAPAAARTSAPAAPADGAALAQSQATEEVAAQDADPSPQILIGTADDAAADGARMPDVTLPYLPGPSLGDIDTDVPTPVVEGPIFISEPALPSLPDMGFDDIIGPSIGSDGQEIVFDNSFASGPDLYEAASLIAPVA